jgi:hypothetical protein
VAGVWVTPELPTEIPDADWPKYSGLPGVVQVDAPVAPVTPLEQVKSELLVVAAELQALEAASPTSESAPA